MSRQRELQSEFAQHNRSAPDTKDVLCDLLAEHHHQIGNSFQTLLSFIRLRMKKSEVLPRADIEAISSFLMLLATLHSHLGENVRLGKTERTVSIELLLTQVLDDWGARASHLRLTRELLIGEQPAKRALGFGSILVAILASTPVSKASSFHCKITEDESIPSCINLSAEIGHDSSVTEETFRNDSGIALACALSKGASRSGLDLKFPSPTLTLLTLEYR